MIEEVIPTWTSESMEEIGIEICSETGHPWISIGIELKESATPETRGINPFACISEVCSVCLVLWCPVFFFFFFLLVCGINLHLPPFFFLLSLGHPQVHFVLLTGIERGTQESTLIAPVEIGSHITAQVMSDLRMKEVLSAMIMGLQIMEVSSGGVVFKL